MLSSHEFGHTERHCIFCHYLSPFSKCMAAVAACFLIGPKDFAIQYWIIFEDVHRDLYLKFCSIAGSSTHQRGASLYGTLQNLLYQTLDITTHSLKM